jgi:hypothetical protein
VRYAFVILIGSLCLHGADARFRQHTIATDLKGGYQVVAVDMNKDGKPDLIAVASGMKELVWFENPTWERHVIAGGFTGMINVAALDVGGDGIPELVLAHGFSNEAKNSAGIVSVLTHNGDPRQPWTVREIDRIPTSHRLRWADIDGSGRKVLINAALTGPKAFGPEYRGNTPLVFYRPGVWKRELIGDQNEGVVHGIYVVDWDHDGRQEILTAGFTGIHMYKLEKDGHWSYQEFSKGDPAAWPKGGSSDVAVGQCLKSRYIAAIEPWHGNEMVIYVKHGKRWDRNVVDNTLVDGHTILTADFNGDHRDEVVAGFRGKGRSVYIYAADRSATTWKRSSLDEGGMAAAACTTADLNGDGRLDIACIGSATTNLKWYENVGSAKKKR